LAAIDGVYRHGEEAIRAAGDPSAQADLARHSPRAEQRDRADARRSGIAGREGGHRFTHIFMGRLRRSGCTFGGRLQTMTSLGQIP
jgi:hypothetical protein